jgi:hypothetical protein
MMVVRPIICGVTANGQQPCLSVVELHVKLTPATSLFPFFGRRILPHPQKRVGSARNERAAVLCEWVPRDPEKRWVFLRR